MTQDPQDQRDQPPPPMALDYGKPPSGLPYGWQAALGAFIACTVILGSALTGIFVGMAGVILLPLLLVMLFIMMGASLRRTEHSRGWAAGFFIGTATAVLIDGLCWVALTNVRFGG